MGKKYGIKCAGCDYSFRANEGVGMMYSMEGVFYGWYNPTKKWNIALFDGMHKMEKPLILSLIKDKRIEDSVFKLLTDGAAPSKEYAHEVYSCPECNRLANRFYFKLILSDRNYEPDYCCPHCDTLLQRVTIKSYMNGECKIVYKNDSSKKWECPECGCKKLVYEDYAAIWD
jgi:ssDNA-binding Zn-finger/Zn-ribbon topoisomerase 1